MAYNSPAKKAVPTRDEGFEYQSPAMTIHGRPYYPPIATKKPVPTSDENALRKKLLEIHAHDGAAAFDTESLLVSIEGILKHGTPGVDFTDYTQKQHDPTNQVLKFPTAIQPTGPDGLLDTLPHLLHKITCVLNCKCSGGDGHAVAMEILQLLANYTWETKIVIVLASFVVEFGHYSLVTMLYKTNSLAKFLAFFKQIPDQADDFSKFEAITRLVQVSIEVTRFIAKFGCFPSKYISNDAEPMAVALNQIPIAVYWMTRVIVICASEHSEILGQTQISTSYTETWNITTLEQKITAMKTTFTTQFDFCNAYIEEKKQFIYYEKLKVMFGQTTIYVDNQKILQAILIKKDGLCPLSRGSELTTKFGVEVLKGKTVLLLISDLEISVDEIEMMSQFYKETRIRTELQYEIVWVPIVERIEEYEERFLELKRKMPWYAMEHPNLLKLGFMRYVKEEWRYSQKSIMVALDQRGKVAHQNALHMMWTWGNTAYPFTYRRELDLWSRKEWSLTLLVEEVDTNISTWIKEGKVICLYGGENYTWIEEFIETASYVAREAGIEIEMVYVCKKNTRQEHITKVKGIAGGRSVVWENSTSTFFWKRIECMMYSKVHHGARVATAREAGDHILGEVLNMLTLGDSEKGWALISQGAGSGIGKMARGNGDVILEALAEFESWKNEFEREGFGFALHGYLAGRSKTGHHCNRLILPGVEDIPGTVACAECQRPMEKYIMYRCCTD